MKKEELVGLIPAAGVGTRLYPFSRAAPKELYPILGKPVIEHCIENLREGGIRKIFVIVGYQKGAIMDYIGDGSLWGMKVAYLYQLQRRGLGHAILQAKNWIKSTFVVLLGDSFIEPKREIRKMIALHLQERPLGSLMLFKVGDPTSYGVVKFKREKGLLEITDLEEKPSWDRARRYKIDNTYHALCGAYVFEPKIFHYLENSEVGAGGELQLTSSLSMALKSGERLLGMLLKGKYMDIGKWETILKAEKEMLRGTSLRKYEREREKMARRVRKLWEDESVV